MADDDPDPFVAALEALFGASFSRFVDERKRLAAELNARGNPLPSKRLAAISRPPVSVWTVNQLWRHARAEVDALFAAAAKVRGGELAATGVHREIIADLRDRAAELLRADGNAAGEPTLRRITQTLQGLAAAGGFAPDAPGQLTTDRDPPGFEALAGLVGAAPATLAPARSVTKPARTAKQRKPANAAEANDADGTATPEVDPEVAAAARAAAAEAAKVHAAARRTRETAVRTAERAMDAANRELIAARAGLTVASARVATAEAAVAEARNRVDAATAALGETDGGSEG